MPASLNPFFSNTVQVVLDEEGFSWPRRFTDKQLESVACSHLFYTMARSPSGCCLTFSTTGSTIWFTCRRYSPGSREGFRPLGQNVALKEYGRSFDMSDSFDISVDGKFLDPLFIKKGMLKVCWDNPEEKQVLVKCFFPMCHQVGIKDFSCDQEMLPIEKPSGKILCLGDSIMQGFLAKRPAFGLVPLLCEHLGMEIINQGICGFGYDPSILVGMEELGLFDCILVELGTNDWNFSPDLPSLKRRVASFYSRLTTLFPRIPIFAMTPIWRSDLDEPKPCGSFAELSDLIALEAETHVQVQVIDGLSVSPHKSSYYADGFLHPDVEGFRYLSEHLVPLLKPALRI